MSKTTDISIEIYDDDRDVYLNILNIEYDNKTNKVSITVDR